MIILIRNKDIPNRVLQDVLQPIMLYDTDNTWEYAVHNITKGSNFKVIGNLVLLEADDTVDYKSMIGKIKPKVGTLIIKLYKESSYRYMIYSPNKNLTSSIRRVDVLDTTIPEGLEEYPDLLEYGTEEINIK